MLFLRIILQNQTRRIRMRWEFVEFFHFELVTLGSSIRSEMLNPPTRRKGVFGSFFHLISSTDFSSFSSTNKIKSRYGDVKKGKLNASEKVKRILFNFTLPSVGICDKISVMSNEIPKKTETSHASGRQLSTRKTIWKWCSHLCFICVAVSLSCKMLDEISYRLWMIFQLVFCSDLSPMLETAKNFSAHDKDERVENGHGCHGH